MMANMIGDINTYIVVIFIDFIYFGLLFSVATFYIIGKNVIHV